MERGKIFAVTAWGLPAAFWFPPPALAQADSPLTAAVDYWPPFLLAAAVIGLLIYTIALRRRLAAEKKESALRLTALAESEKKYRTIFEQTSDGVSVFERRVGTLHRRLIDCNQAYADMAGRSKAELTAVDDIRRIQAHDHSQAHSRQLQERIEEGLPYSGSFSWVRPDGRENHIEYRAVPVRLGERILVYGIDRDVTARRKAEERLRQAEVARRAAEEASRMKDEFVSVINHELRTPLNNLLGYAQTFQRALKRQQASTEDQEHFLDAILESGRHLSHIVEDILDAARIEAGRLKVDLAPTPAGEILAGMAGHLKRSAEEKQLAFEMDVADFPVIKADRQRFSQVVYNVVGNAIKFTEEGFIRVTGRRNGHGYAVLEVSDSGPGLPEDQVEAVFDRFKRLNEASKLPGLGLGLSISQELMKLMGGQITAANRPDGGAVFRCRFQIWEE
jgi:PAS domain S-box-containing protein